MKKLRRVAGVVAEAEARAAEWADDGSRTREPVSA